MLILAQLRAAAAIIALTHGTVLDVRTGELQPRYTIVIEGNRITAVGPDAQVRVPRGAKVVDCRDKYIIPGLTDSHVHLFLDDWIGGPVDTAAYMGWVIAGGVTSIREMSADGYRHVPLRDAIARGELLGPRMTLSAGPLPNKPDAWAALLERTGMPDRAAAIGSIRKLGVDGLKLMHNGPRDEMIAAVREAREAGVPVYGHTVSIRPPQGAFNGDIDNFTMELVQAGLTGVVHSIGTVRPPGRDDRPTPTLARDTPEGRRAWQRFNMTAWEAVRDGSIQALIDTMVARHVWYEPTLLNTYYWNHRGEYDRAALSSHHRWTLDVRPGTTPSAPSSAALAIEAAAGRFVRRFHEAGGLVLAGTDDIPFAPYGISEELRLLVKAGLSPLAAIQAATINASQAIGWKDVGAIEAGKLADLLVLDADPTRDILNVRKVRAVVLDGRLIDRTQLNAFLARVGQR